MRRTYPHFMSREPIYFLSLGENESLVKEEPLLRDFIPSVQELTKPENFALTGEENSLLSKTCKIFQVWCLSVLLKIVKGTLAILMTNKESSVN